MKVLRIELDTFRGLVRARGFVRILARKAHRSAGTLTGKNLPTQMGLSKNHGFRRFQPPPLGVVNMGNPFFSSPPEQWGCLNRGPPEIAEGRQNGQSTEPAAGKLSHFLKKWANLIRPGTDPQSITVLKKNLPMPQLDAEGAFAFKGMARQL